MNNRVPYNPSIIEPKWQKKWKVSKIYNVDLDSKNKVNYFSLTMFPYPSGDLHIGHWYAFTPADSYSRFKKMKGFNVLHTQGFDAFGLPAENAAISRNINPKKSKNLYIFLTSGTLKCTNNKIFTRILNQAKCGILIRHSIILII